MSSKLWEVQYDFPEYIENLGNIIRKGLMSSSHPSKADIRVKYSWMRERYNHMVDIVNNNKSIERLQKNDNYELADFYKNLKPISPNRYSKNRLFKS